MAVTGLQQYFNKALSQLPSKSELLAASQKAVSSVRGKILHLSIQFPNKRRNLEKLIKALQADVCIEERIEKRPVYSEGRLKLRAEEEEKCAEAASLARRLRAEQEERERKKKEISRAMQREVEKEAQMAAEKAEQHVREMEAQKMERVELLHKQAQLRKQYLESMGKLAGSPRKFRRSFSEPRTVALPKLASHCSDFTTKRYAKSVFLKKVQNREKVEKEKLLQEESSKKERTEKRRHYAILIKEMFMPTIDRGKRDEMKAAQQKESVVRRSLSVQKRPLERKFSEPASVVPVRKIKGKSLSSKLVKRNSPDFLQEVKRNIDKTIEATLQKDAKRLPKLRATEASAEQQERESAIRWELAKRPGPFSLSALQLTEVADRLLISSLKAKLALLQS